MIKHLSGALLGVIRNMGIALRLEPVKIKLQYFNRSTQIGKKLLLISFMKLQLTVLSGVHVDLNFLPVEVMVKYPSYNWLEKPGKLPFFQSVSQQ